MKVLVAAAGAVAVVVIVALLLVAGYTPVPFDRNDEATTGRVENSIGDQHTLTASTLSATWTFTRDAKIVLRISQGSLAINGAALEAGCYSGTMQRGDVLIIKDGRTVSFASPDSDPACRALP
jgi:hypothetical protein